MPFTTKRKLTRRTSDFRKRYNAFVGTLDIKLLGLDLCSLQKSYGICQSIEQNFIFLCHILTSFEVRITQGICRKMSKEVKMSELGVKIWQAKERLIQFEPEEGYYLAFSGGKDSVVIKALAEMAGVKYDAHYNLTSVDPPELVHFIKEKHADVAIDIPRYKDGKQITMWNLIPKKLMPPTRLVRYCCAELKERSGEGRMTITGVRWAESSARAKNQGIVTVADKRAAKLIDEDPNFMSTNRGGWC